MPTSLLLRATAAPGACGGRVPDFGTRDAAQGCSGRVWRQGSLMANESSCLGLLRARVEAGQAGSNGIKMEEAAPGACGGRGQTVHGADCQRGCSGRVWRQGGAIALQQPEQHQPCHEGDRANSDHHEQRVRRPQTIPKRRSGAYGQPWNQAGAWPSSPQGDEQDARAAPGRRERAHRPPPDGHGRTQGGASRSFRRSPEA